MTGTSTTPNESKSARQETATPRRAVVIDTITSGFWTLRFPKLLEGQFLEDYLQRSNSMLRWLIPAVFGLQLTYGALMVSIHDVPRLWFTHSWLPISIVLIAIEALILTGIAGRFIHFLVSILACVALSSTLYTIALIGDAPFATELSWYVLLQLMVIFSLLRLRFRLVVLTSLIPPSIGLGLEQLAGLTLDWKGLSQYYGLGVLVCASVAYAMEQMNRAAWLQTQQLDIEMASLKEMQDNALVEHERQRALGKYMTLISGNLTHNAISDLTLKFLIEQANALLGAVYLVEESGLSLAGKWGLTKNEKTDHKLRHGETMVGQVASSGERLQVHHLPDNYLLVRSALGQATPKTVLIEPVSYQNKVLAVIELAKFEPFTDNEIELIAQTCHAMGPTLVAASARNKSESVESENIAESTEKTRR